MYGYITKYSMMMAKMSKTEISAKILKRKKINKSPPPHSGWRLKNESIELSGDKPGVLTFRDKTIQAT